MDTLQFTQLSQNLDASVMYTFQKSETRNQRLSLLASYQQSADEQGGISLPGNVSRFVNTALGYGLTLIPQNINFTTSLNGTYNYAGMVKSYTVGPMAGVTAGFFNKTLSCGFSTSYNVSMTDGEVQGKVLNLRANAAYRFWKKHNLTGNVVWQNRIIKEKKTNGITSIVAYSYSFQAIFD